MLSDLKFLPMLRGPPFTSLPQSSYGRDGLQIWRVAVNISISWQPTRGSPTAWGLGGEWRTSHFKNKHHI